MSNKASEHVDRAHTRVDSILTNKTNLSSTPDINLLLEEALRKIQCLDTNYQKIAQEVEGLRLAVAQYEKEKVANYHTISKLMVQDVIVAAKTKMGFQEVQETQSRHDVALQQHQSKLIACTHDQKMNKLEADMKNKANNERLISMEKSLETLKATQAQQCERMDSTDEKFENFILKVQMDERNARRRSKTGSSLEEFVETYHEPSPEELKLSREEALQNVSLIRLYEQAVDRQRLDSGVSITSTESLQLQLQDECPTSSLPITSPDSDFNSLAPSRETSSHQLKFCDNVAPMNPIMEASPSQLKTYQVPTIQISEATNDS